MSNVPEITESQRAEIIRVIDEALKDLEKMKEDFDRAIAEPEPSRFDHTAYWIMDRLQSLLDKVIHVFKRGDK